MASDADGNFVVAWDTGLLFDVFARRYNALGQPLGDEFRVPADGAGDQSSPSVAMNSDGDFVIAWAAGDGIILVQRYSAAGVLQGEPIRVNPVRSGGVASVAIDADGDFAVAWNTFIPTQDGVYARLFAADGTPRTDEFQVPQFTSAEERNPVVVMDDDGGFVVAWESNLGESSVTRWDIYARRFDAQGDALGGDLRVNTTAFGSIEQQPAMALAPDDTLLVTWWSSHRETGGETGDGGIFGQFFDPAGAPAGGEFRVNQTTAGAQTSPAVGVDALGNYLVAWADPAGVMGRAYTAAGAAGPEFLVADTPSPGIAPAVAVDPRGDTIVTYTAFGDNRDVFARLLTTRPAVTGVFAGSAAWAPAFRQFLGDWGQGDPAAGFSIGAGAEQLKPLPWTRLDRISVRFNMDVAVDRDDLVVRGTRAAGYGFSDFAYNPVSHTATWTLASPLDRDVITLELDADPPAGVRAAGVAEGPPVPLDGDWRDGIGAFPSGNGTPGGDFVFRINVLPGDVNRSGAVLADDFAAVKGRFFYNTMNPSLYSIFLDVDGSGSIVADDFSEVKKRFFQRLPPS